MAELRNAIVGKFRTWLQQAIATLDRDAGTAWRVIAATNDHWRRDANGGNVGQRNE